MPFIETSIFTRRILELLDDESHRALQEYLMFHPDAGRPGHPGSGGLRKLRWRVLRAPGRLAAAFESSTIGS